MSQVRITPWDDDNTVDIDAVYTTLSWTRDVRTPSGTVKRDLDDYTDIFKGDERIENPKRILVYGRPGIGKSTFSQKLAVDWANRRKENLEGFELFLLIKLRDVGISQDLPAILNASKLLAADGSTSSESLYEFVLHNQEKVLLVFDGFDEYSGGKKSPVHEIWKGEQLRDCCVIITTREMEGGELMKLTPFQFEIRGFLKKEQIVSFASRFITAQEEVEEFYNYLDKRNLQGLAKIPLLLLMLSLIWRNRDCKELPVSQLGLHERFVQTLLHHMDTNDFNNGREKKTQEEETENEKQSENVLVKYKDELTVVGRLALEALLLRSAPYIDLNEVNVESGGLTYKMIRSGLFQFSKLAVADPTKRIFFLHKSIQEYLVARYIMNNAALEEIDGKFTGIDSFDKAFRLFYILRFMCAWSQEGAIAVFTLLDFLGKKDNLSKCSLSKTPCISDLSEYQRRFRDMCLECLVSCSVSFRQDLFHSFFSCVDNVVTVNATNRRKLAAGRFPISGGSPRYIFFHGSNLPLSVLADLKACVVTPRGHKLDAHKLVERYVLSSLESEHFFLINEGGQFYFYFATIVRKDEGRYHEMLLELTHTKYQSFSDFPVFRIVAQNCFSLVQNFIFLFTQMEELTFLSDLLPCLLCPRSVSIQGSSTGKNFTDPELEKLTLSKINVTDNLRILELSGLDVTNKEVAELKLPSGCKVKFSRW